MKKQNQYFPQSVPHPGTTIDEKLKELGMSTEALSKKIGYNLDTLKEVIKGRKPIDSELAVGLEDAFHVPATYWMNAQHNFNQALHEAIAKTIFVKNNRIKKGQVVYAVYEVLPEEEEVRGQQKSQLKLFRKKEDAEAFKLSLELESSNKLAVESGWLWFEIQELQVH